MATTTPVEVHAGDIGTLYKARFLDRGAPFDPTLATIKKLIWKPPSGGAVFSRDAQVVFETPYWYLTYTVTAAEPTFHVKGTYQLQGYVEFTGGEKYHTNIETYTVQGNLVP